ncbi:hypothetical protein ACADC178_0812 [Lactobacillus delbrueckii subsp. lactis]|nr:hypothetical protein ACADC178_0812 [Lactobacillus delbrueckii subsp. lactis]
MGVILLSLVTLLRNGVFPTQVGVILNAEQAETFDKGIPHASGGDPETDTTAGAYVGYSPRKWG